MSWHARDQALQRLRRLSAAMEASGRTVKQQRVAAERMLAALPVESPEDVAARRAALDQIRRKS